MKYTPDFSSRFRILKGGKISLVVSALIAGSTMSFAAPSGGVVNTGSATITQNGSVTTIDQSTQRASINWQDFSIASHETVNFNQPSSSAVTLNRVVGNERSVIDGALNANGQVWILNSNGVLFGKDASVNTAGLVASTMNMSDENFMNGSTAFESTGSSASVINMGTIRVTDGAYVALLGKEVANEGLIQATKGTVALSAGDKITLNFNGDSLVGIAIDEGTLNALVENKGAIIADGGKIFLTTKAAANLLNGVVNNTGLLQANSLDDITGHIEVFAHGGTANVGGTIEAQDGFVETSGKEFIFDAADIKAGEWLIDPVNITIDAGLASAIGTALNTGDVTITTDGSNTPDTLSGEVEGNGNITVNSAITKSSGTKTKLTLAAERDISVNAAISGSSGSSLDIVLASRFKGGTLGGVYVGANIKSYGGDITIGGGNINASDFAITHSSTPYGDNKAGVFIGQAIIDATGDGSGTADNTLPTVTTGGNIAIRGKGDLNNGHQFNEGVYFYINKTIGVVTGGSGNIYIEGHGGKANAHFWDVGAVGINWESSNTYIKANAGDITLKGYAGTVADRYGISSGNTFIGTNGYLDIEGDSYMLRSGALSLNVGGSGDIKAPMLGSGTYSLAKTGNGVLNISGDAEYWHNNRPSVTTDTGTNGTFTDTTNTVNLVNLTRTQALYAFMTVPTTINTVTQSAATPATTLVSAISLSYTLSDILSGYTYNGTSYSLNTLWSASTIFGADYSSWVAGTDYAFIYGGNTVTGFANAGNYSNIAIDILKSGYAEALAGNTVGSLLINKAPISSISGITAGNKTYDGTIAATLNTANAVFNGKFGSDMLSITGASGVFADKNAGTGKSVSISGITLSGESAANYELSNTTASTTADITAKAITVSATVLDKVYDATTAATATLTSAGIVEGDSVTLSGTATFADKNVGLAKTVTVGSFTKSGTDGANYTLENESATDTATITAKAITVSATVETKTYDGTTDATASLDSSDIIEGDSVTLSGTATFDDENVGEGKTITIALLSKSGTDAANYTIANESVTSTADITEPAITVSESDTEHVITAIVSAETVHVEVPRIVHEQLKVEVPRTPTYSEGREISLVSAPLEGQHVEKISMNEVTALQKPAQSSSASAVQETRVALYQDSVVDLINGGVNLPEGVHQEFYVVKNDAPTNTNIEKEAN
jgi:filamentous hemagglutinin family protein